MNLMNIRRQSPPKSPRQVRFDDDSFRLGSPAEEGSLVSRPESVYVKPTRWERVQRAFRRATPATPLLPACPPPSPSPAPKPCFDLYESLRHKFETEANKCVQDLKDHRERQVRMLKHGISLKPREFNMSVGPIFLRSTVGYIGIDDSRVEEFLSAAELTTLHVVAPVQGPYSGELLWGPSTGFDTLLDTVQRLNRWCGKNGLDNLTIGFQVNATPDVLPHVPGACHPVQSVWFRCDPPDASAVFGAR